MLDLPHRSKRLMKQIRSKSFKWIYPRWPGVHNAVFFSLRRRLIRAKSLIYRNAWQWMPGIFDLSNPETDPWNPLVSIIVPCFNHAEFLRERLDSIINQTYQNIEVILLDDGSTDGSKEILTDFHRRHSDKTRLIINEANTGAPFSQWSKGIDESHGELIWIAESDDYCELNFLESLVPCFQNRGVMIGIGRSSFISYDGKQEVWSLEQYLPSLGSRFWTMPFTETTQRLVSRIWCNHNIIPNASGCIFRRPANKSIRKETWWQSLKVCGDWLFYLDLARGGMVAYTPLAINYYRQHRSNSSIALHGKPQYFDEHLIVAQWIVSQFALQPACINSIQHELKKRWLQSSASKMPINTKADVDQLATIEGPFNILVVTYALVAGGGEIFPIRLANGLKDRGYTVAILNCNQRTTQTDVLDMINPGIPVLTLGRLQDLGQIIAHFSINIAHTHHAWVDTTIAELIGDFKDVAQVITSHGMYDYMDEHELKRIGKLLENSVRVATYVSHTNHAALNKAGFSEESLMHIGNSTRIEDVQAFERSALGISQTSVVVSLVSRAIKEKGWEEAIKAICILHDQFSYEIDLLLVGDGPMHTFLSERYRHLPFIHFVGFCPDACSIFAGSDIGLLPSFFQGESQPLTLIESLLVGTPYVASDLGDIAKMLASDYGLAGGLIPIRTGYCHPEDIAESIQSVIDSKTSLEEYRLRARAAAQKFSWEHMMDQYICAYKQALQKQSSRKDRIRP